MRGKQVTRGSEERLGLKSSKEREGSLPMMGPTL